MSVAAGVIEDDILNHAQPVAVQRLNHAAVFAGAILGIHSVAAFRRDVVQRIIAPVESISVLNRGNGGLLLVGVRSIGAKSGVVCQVDLSSLMVAKSKFGNR